MTRSDEELIVAAAGGDREAFAELYRRLRPAVYRFAVHMTGSPAAAEDVAQETFVTVITDAGRYQTERSGVVPWLLGIARNHARRRGAKERPVEPLPADSGDSDLAVGASQAEAVVRDEELAGLRRALRGLPETYREVVVLCDLQEFSYADAADTIGCAIGTVRSRLHRGRAMLAVALKGMRGQGQRWVAPARIV